MLLRILLLLLSSQCHAELYSIMDASYPLYQDTFPNSSLFLRGTGFTARSRPEFEPSLSSFETEYVSPTALTVRISTSKWLSKDPKLPYQVLYVSRVREGEDAAFEPKRRIPVARVFQKPRVGVDVEPRVMGAMDEELVIKGTGFTPKETGFVFEPKLRVNVDYEIEIGENGEKARLVLMPGGRWVRKSGTLALVAVLGGAGRVEIQPPVVVADVRVVEGDSGVDLSEIIAVVDAVPFVYRTYRGSHEISIRGENFKAARPPRLVFKQSGAPIQGTDFDVITVSSTEIVARLRKSSLGWLPQAGALQVSEINGEVISNTPVQVAVVVETPIAEMNRRSLCFETDTATIVIKGTGFPSTASIEIGTSPDLSEIATVLVRDGQTLELELSLGKAWPLGPIFLIWISSYSAPRVIQNRDSPEKGLRIAMVEPNFKGVVSIRASSQRVYASATEEFSVDVLVLPPKFQLAENQDVPVKVELSGLEKSVRAAGPDSVLAYLSVAENVASKLTFKLIDNQRDAWLDASDGRLFLTAIYLPAETAGDHPIRYPLGEIVTGSGPAKRQSSSGVQIARIIPNVRMTLIEPPPLILTSQTHTISLRGSGFTNFMESGENIVDDDPLLKMSSRTTQAIVFDPPLIQDYDFDIVAASSTQLLIRLMEKRQWRMTPGPLNIVSLNSGAGPALLNVLLGRVIADDPDMICTNDCPFGLPFDQICDDGDVEPGTDEVTCWGRDCADCGPRRKSAMPVTRKDSSCTDSCGLLYIKDGQCQDGRPGASGAQCSMCSDCSDCGPCPEGSYTGLSWCTNGVEGAGGENGRPPRSVCAFPFKHNGKTYERDDGCIKDGRVASGWGWCPITNTFETDGKWGSCQYCIDVLDTLSDDDYSAMAGTMDDLDDYAHNAETELSRPAKKIRASNNEASGVGRIVAWIFLGVFFLAAAACFFFVYMKRQKGSKAMYELVDTKGA